MTKKAHPHREATRALRAFALTFPEAHTKSPWPGHLDAAVRDKTFAHMSLDNEPLTMSCKLPESQALALGFSFAEPTGYGLGKSGWVTAKFADEESIPVPLLEEWIAESYRAIAPKSLVKLLAPADEKSTLSPKKTPKKGPLSKAAPKVAKKRSGANGRKVAEKVEKKASPKKVLATRTKPKR